MATNVKCKPLLYCFELLIFVCVSYQPFCLLILVASIGVPANHLRVCARVCLSWVFARRVCVCVCVRVCSTSYFKAKDSRLAALAQQVNCKWRLTLMYCTTMSSLTPCTFFRGGYTVGCFGSRPSKDVRLLLLLRWVQFFRRHPTRLRRPFLVADISSAWNAEVWTSASGNAGEFKADYRSRFRAKNSVKGFWASLHNQLKPPTCIVIGYSRLDIPALPVFNFKRP